MSRRPAGAADPPAERHGPIVPLRRPPRRLRATRAVVSVGRCHTVRYTLHVDPGVDVPVCGFALDLEEAERRARRALDRLARSINATIAEVIDPC